MHPRVRARTKRRIVKSQSATKSAMSQGDGAAPEVGGALSPLTPGSQPPPEGSSSKGNPTNAASAFPVGDARVVSTAGDSSISSSENCMSQYGGMTPGGRMEGVASRGGGEIRSLAAYVVLLRFGIVFVISRDVICPLRPSLDLLFIRVIRRRKLPRWCLFRVSHCCAEKKNVVSEFPWGKHVTTRQQTAQHKHTYSPNTSVPSFFHQEGEVGRELIMFPSHVSRKMFRFGARSFRVFAIVYKVA